MAFLNDPGLQALWQNVVARLNNLVEAVPGKGLSTNDYTDEDKIKVENAATEIGNLNEQISEVGEKADEALSTIDTLEMNTVQVIEQTFTEEQKAQARENIGAIVGENTTGTVYTIDEESVTAGEYAEVFNNYSNNIASGKYSHAENYNTTAKGSYSHAEGYGTLASGAASHAEGYNTKATARYAHAEGAATIASGSNSHAEGNGAVSSGHYSHAEGNATTSSGGYSHAEGNYTTASETFAHAEGSNTTASGTGAHAEGNYTVASGTFAHAEGYYTLASSPYQHVRGKFNVIDENEVYSTIIGNGNEESARSNAHTLDWEGNAWYQGEVYVGGTSQDSENATRLLKESEIATDDEILDMLIEMNVVTPFMSNNKIITNSEGKIYSL